MAKLYKVEMYILDVNDCYTDLNDIVIDIERSTDIWLKPFNTQDKQIEWSDDIDLNFNHQGIEVYRKYFE